MIICVNDGDSSVIKDFFIWRFYLGNAQSHQARAVINRTWQANMGVEGVAFTRSSDERRRRKAEIFRFYS